MSVLSLVTHFLFLTHNTALGDIGKLNDNIQAAVVWAIRFESEPGIRAEAYRTLVRIVSVSKSCYPFHIILPYNTALGDIGKLNDNIQAAVVWAIRFESEPGVRAEACRTLVRIGVQGTDVPPLLQDKLLVEPDKVVRE